MKGLITMAFIRKNFVTRDPNSRKNSFVKSFVRRKGGGVLYSNGPSVKHVGFISRHASSLHADTVIRISVSVSNDYIDSG